MNSAVAVAYYDRSGRWRTACVVTAAYKRATRRTAYAIKRGDLIFPFKSHASFTSRTRKEEVLMARVLTNEEIDEIVREPWTVHLHSYDDLARTMDVMRRSAKSWHKAYELAMAHKAADQHSGKADE